MARRKEVEPENLKVEAEEPKAEEKKNENVINKSGSPKIE